MGRRTLQVDKDILIQSISKAESNGPLPNLDSLWRTTERIYNMTPGIPESVNSSTIMLRVNQWGIPILTKAGKKGRQKGESLTPEHKAAMQAGRKRSKATDKNKERCTYAMLEQLELNKATRYTPLVELAVNGKASAARKLNCLGCMGYVRSEIRDCSDFSCPFFLKRPYQKLKDEAEPENIFEGIDNSEDQVIIEGQGESEIIN